MCTAIAGNERSRYFGRNLDIEYDLQRSLISVPTGVKLRSRHQGEIERRCAFVGVGMIKDSFPLLFDGMNEYGIAVAALSFIGNAEYARFPTGSVNIASYELIPYVLSTCKSMSDVSAFLDEVCITDDAFAPDMPPSDLHWMISDGEKSIVAESVSDGMRYYPNPVGVLTNNPSFPSQLQNLSYYMRLTPDEPENSFCQGVKIERNSYGLGAVGLPGDCSSQSRFVRCSFVKLNADMDTSPELKISQLFHILSSCEMTKGCVRIKERREYTHYSCVMDTEKRIYYLRTYGSGRICSFDLSRIKREESFITCTELPELPDIRELN